MTSGVSCFYERRPCGSIDTEGDGANRCVRVPVGLSVLMRHDEGWLCSGVPKEREVQECEATLRIVATLYTSVCVCEM